MWGATNPFVRRGVLIADKRLPSFKPSGFAAIDAILCHITTPAYVVPQLLNLSGSLLFAYSLAQQGVSVSIFSPVANGVSLASNALFDHLLGDYLDPRTTIPGLLLIFIGITLCTTATALNPNE